MGICPQCSKEKRSFTNSICDDCWKENERKRLEDISNSIECCADFKDVSGKDMSEIFWTELEKWTKDHNEKSKRLCKLAFGWACHANHGLSNSFAHAMEWAGMRKEIKI